MTYKKILLFICLILCFPLNICASTTTEKDIITPRASYVFMDVASTVSKSYYGGDCVLYSVGSGTIVATLQKKNSSGAWKDVSGCTVRKSFANTTVAAVAGSKALTAGTYRCKTYVIATVTDITETKTVYSPALTITSSN